MIFKIPENQKEIVTRLFLEGETRKNIAKKCGVSEGTVSNITDELRRQIGQGDAESLRDFVVSLKKVGLNISQCFEGSRTHALLKKLGVEDEKELTLFILKLYNNCRATIEDTHQNEDISSHLNASQKRKTFTPDEIASYFRDFLHFVEISNEGLASLPRYINEMTTQYIKIRNLKVQHRVLVSRILHAQRNSADALEKEKVTSCTLQNYLETKKELAKYNLDVDSDVRCLVDTLNTIGKNFGFDVERIICEFQDINILYIKMKHISRKLQEKEQRLAHLNETCFILEQRVNIHTRLLEVYHDLESLGFGIARLKVLKNYIEEIATDNRVPSELLMKRIFERIESEIQPKRRRIQYSSLRCFHNQRLETDHDMLI
jgi:hypothetical protein